MIAANRFIRLTFAPLRITSFKNGGYARVSAFLILIGLLAATFYFPSSASSVSRSSSLADVKIGVGGAINKLSSASSLGISSITSSSAAGFSALMAFQSPPPESVVIGTPAEPRPAGCNNADQWCLGETVPVVVTGAPLREGFRERRIQWIAPDGTVPHMWDVDENVENDSYTLETVGSFAQIGTWTVRTINNRNGGVVVTTFVVADPSQPSADLEVTMTGPSGVTANTNVSYVVSVTNLGPDAAANVSLLNPVPYNTSFASASAPVGFVCTTPLVGEAGDIDCTGASLLGNTSASFTFTFSVNSNVVGGTSVYNVAKVGSSTNDPNLGNNYGDINSQSTPPTGGGGTCDLDCPNSFNVIANTTVEGERGAYVTYPAPVPHGDCGIVTSTPSSGSFFPVGTTEVTATSGTNGGSCTFTITVEDQGANPPTISCPTDKSANADSNCAAAIVVGTATAAGTNVTVTATRSDGRPMYTCDVNGTNCTRVSSDDPFSSGVTTITWIAYSHSVGGPYADADDEEAKRTGAASCTQTITVDDVTPPSITAPSNQTASADATCQFELPDYTLSASVSDNCACASSDESEICDAREPITITQSPAPGTLVGLGPHTITLTANDGSSNNGGAGNTATAQFTVTVNDTTAPTVTAPADSSASADANCQAPVPDYIAGSTTSDNCDSSVILTQSPAAGTMVGKGPHTVTVTATDDAGNSANDVVVFTVNDTTPPTISCPTNIVVYLPLNSTATSKVVTYTAPTGADNCSGATTVQTTGLPSGASFPVGTTTNTFTVTDAANLSTSCSFTVTVLYNFTGFFSPVSNLPTLNSVNAGKNIPVKFSLSGNKGLDIMAPNNPYSVSFNCATNDPGVDIIETNNPGNSTLSYSPDTYHYNWKTEKAWEGTCRQLVITLNDGSVHTANFKFK